MPLSWFVTTSAIWREATDSSERADTSPRRVRAGGRQETHDQDSCAFSTTSNSHHCWRFA